jgi:hypothetical protein
VSNESFCTALELSAQYTHVPAPGLLKQAAAVIRNQDHMIALLRSKLEELQKEAPRK